MIPDYKEYSQIRVVQLVFVWPSEETVVIVALQLGMYTNRFRKPHSLVHQIRCIRFRQIHKK